MGSKTGFTMKKASASAQMEQIIVDWNKFGGRKDPEEEFLNIHVQHHTIKPLTRKQKELDHGTILEITNLGSKWTREKKIGLKQSLEETNKSV